MVGALMADGGPAWADAGVICPWTIYLCYGDKEILAKNYDVMTRFMDFLLATSPGYIRCAPDYEGWLGFGDWLSINADTPRDLIGTAFLAYDANLMAQIAAVLGKTRDAARYRKLFADVKKAFAARFLVGAKRSEAETQAAIDRTQVAEADAISRGNLKTVEYGPVDSKVFATRFFQPTQTAYVLALHFDLLPAKLRPLAAAELVADIERRGDHLSTGFVGSPYLPHVLSSNGRLDVAYKLLAQTTWPSWLYPVTQGATTIWERWDGWTPENGFQDTGMNSFNHYAYGAIGAWLYNTVAGIEIDPAAARLQAHHPAPAARRRSHLRRRPPGDALRRTGFRLEAGGRALHLGGRRAAQHDGDGDPAQRGHARTGRRQAPVGVGGIEQACRQGMAQGPEFRLGDSPVSAPTIRPLGPTGRGPSQPAIISAATRLPNSTA